MRIAGGSVRRTFLVCVLTLVILPSPRAWAAQGAAAEIEPRNPGTVTLGVSPSTVDYGSNISLTGAISPIAAGETITIKNGGGNVVATATTDALGNYATSFVPDSNMTLHAEWGVDTSATTDVHVRAAVSVRIENVYLFGRARVSGTVQPATPGAPVTVSLVRKGDGVVKSVTADQRTGGNFVWRSTALDTPGDYQATATAGAPGLDDGTADSAWRDTPMPNLHPGSSGTPVLYLEKRLIDLGYHFFGINEHYDERTGDAVMAFRKVQGMVRTDDVSTAVWKALADPKPARPKQNLNGRYIEVDLSKQVLYVVDDGEVTYILHVSTGKPTTPTPPGHYRIRFKRPGMNASGMYYSSYFLEHFAIHGYASVPPYNASHGCVRVPIWHAKWMYGIAKVGTRMAIYG